MKTSITFSQRVPDEGKISKQATFDINKSHAGSGKTQGKPTGHDRMESHTWKSNLQVCPPCKGCSVIVYVAEGFE